MSNQSEKLQETITELIARLIGALIIATVIWAILHLIFALQVTWLQVTGGYFLAGIVKRYLTD